MRLKIEAMQHEVNEFMDYVKHELSRGLGDWEQRLSTAMVKSSPTDLVRTQSSSHTESTTEPANPTTTRSSREAASRTGENVHAVAARDSS